MLTAALLPESLAQLGEMLREMTPQSKVIGGGTDLIIRMNQGLCTPDVLLYAGGVPALREVVSASEGVWVGAAATMAELAVHPLLAGEFAAVRDAAADVGAEQIRTSATIGGNIANASPAGDLGPVLFLLGARVEILGPGGVRRTLPIQAFLLGPGKTALAHNEIVTRFLLPRAGHTARRSAFVKLGFRRDLTISRIGLAMAVERDAAGSITRADLVAGAISLTPVHVEQAEQALPGRALDAHAAQIAGEALSALITEITPEHFDRDYKARAARGIAADVCELLVSRD